MKIQIYTKNKSGGTFHTTDPNKSKGYLSRIANRLKKGHSKMFPMVFKVDYGKGFTNMKEDCMNLSDLSWCQTAFVREYING